VSRLSRYGILGVVAILAAGLGAAVAHYSRTPESPERALLLDSPRTLPGFQLVDHHEIPFGPERLLGRWTFVFFGFTHCPDVCPTTLFTLNEVVRQLDDLPEDERPAVLMVSVDPNRDTPEKLADYVPYFNPDFLGVTGDMPQILSLTKAMGVAFTYTPRGDGAEGYAVDHTASIFVLDPDGRLAAVFGTPHAAGEIAGDYRIILEKRG
jgi:protein SCO1/2